VALALHAIRAYPWVHGAADGHWILLRCYSSCLLPHQTMHLCPMCAVHTWLVVARPLPKASLLHVAAHRREALSAREQVLLFSS
jgi:hypothetical protein